MNRYLKLIFALILSIFLVGCGDMFVSTNIEELLVAPQPSSLQHAALTAVKVVAGEQAVLVDDGSFSGETSILAFYNSSNTATDINIALLRLVDETLVSVSEVSGLGVGVQHVEYAQLEIDAPPMLIVSYNGTTPGETFLTVYKYTQGEFDPIFAQSYQHFTKANLTQNDNDELVFTLPTDETGTMKMRVISFADGEAVELYSGTPDESIASSLSLSVSHNNGKEQLAIDAYNSGGIIVSELLEYSEDKGLFSVLSENDKLLLQRSSLSLLSKDVDGDGIIEQPGVLAPLNGMEEGEYFLVGYYDLNKNNYAPKYVSIVNFNNAFMVTIPAHWQDEVRFQTSENGFTLIDNSDFTKLLAIDLINVQIEPIQLHIDGATGAVLLLGSSRMYLTTFGTLSDYTLAYLRDGIQTLY